MNLNDVICWVDLDRNVNFGYVKGFRANGMVVIDTGIIDMTVTKRNNVSILDLSLEKYLTMSEKDLQEEFPEYYV